MGASTLAQQPATADPSSDKMILALTKFPKAGPGKTSKAPVKKSLVTVTGPTTVVIVSMAMFGPGTHIEQDDKGVAVLASPAELGLSIKDSRGDYRIEADQRTKIAAELVNKDFLTTDKGRMVLYIKPGIPLRVTGLLRGDSIEATSIVAVDAGAIAGAAAEPK
jgi:hypothetical protein